MASAQRPSTGKACTRNDCARVAGRLHVHRGSRRTRLADRQRLSRARLFADRSLRRAAAHDRRVAAVEERTIGMGDPMKKILGMVLLAASTAAWAQPPQGFEAHVDAVMKSAEVPGMAIAI